MSVFTDLSGSEESSIIIKERLFDKIITELSDNYSYDVSEISIGTSFYIPENDNLVFSITDSVLAKNLFLALQNNPTLPEGFEDLKFVILDKEEKVVFLMYPYTNASPNVFLDNLTESMSKVHNFINYISLDDAPIYLDYIEFISLVASTKINENIVNALLKSLRSEAIIPTTYSCTGLIDTLFGAYFPYNSISCSRINGSADDFFSGIRHGISYGGNLTTSIPSGLYVNLLKYALSKDLDDFKDLFVFDSSFDNLDVSKTTIVFDEERFNKSLSLTNSDEKFLYYRYLDDKSYEFIKLKEGFDPKDFYDVFQSLAHTGFLNASGTGYSTIVHCPENRFFIKRDIFSHYDSLRDVAKNYADSSFSKRLESFITNIVNISKENTLFFKKDADLLSCICTNISHFRALSNNAPHFCLKDISKLTLKTDENGEPFDIDLLIMQFAKEIVLNTKRNNIYSYSFIKMFPPIFVANLIKFINTGEYTRSDKPLLLDGILDYDICASLTFIEDINPNVEGKIGLESYSFFEEVSVENFNKELADKIAESRCSTDPNVFSFEEKLKSLNVKVVTKDNLNILFSKSANSSLDLDRFDLLLPEKIIVSTSEIEDGNYKILGIKWNHKRCLYTFASAINNKLINTKQLYLIILNLLRLEHRHNLNFISDILTDTILVTIGNQTDVIVNPKGTLEKYISKETSNSEFYYTCILTVLEQYVSLDGFDIFKYKDLTFSGGLFEFTSNVSSMQNCPHHPGHWTFWDDGTQSWTCPVCRKVYSFTDKYEFEDSLDCNYEEYSTSISYFHVDEDDKIVLVSSNRYINDKFCNNVETGILNNLFDDFKSFKPERIVMDNDFHGNQLGILFNDFDFEGVLPLSTFTHIRRLKVVLVMYKKILPKIQNGTFLCDNSKIFESMFMHKNCKGEIIVPDIMLLDCNTIVSDDEAKKEKLKSKTLELFSTFLYNYITSDETLTVISEQTDLLTEILKSIKDLSFKEDLIKEYVDPFTSYCTIHKCAFSSNHKICPVCLKDGIDESLITLKSKSFFDSLANSDEKYSGGEANLYGLTSGDILKSFNPGSDLKFKSKILGKAFEKSAQIQSFNDAHDDVKIISIKKAVYMFENNMLTLKGFTQQDIQDSFAISELRKKDFVAQINYSRKDIVKILINVCKGIEFIHSINGFIGDLNGGNIIIKDKIVYIIDIDGMSFDDVKNNVFTPTYIYPPSAESKNITADDDWYSLAVQAFYYLTYSHPFRGTCNLYNFPEKDEDRMREGYSVLGNHGITPPSVSIGWDHLPDYLVKYFLKTFEDSKRESMLTVLEKYLQDIEKSELKFIKVERQNSVKKAITENIYLDKNNNIIFQENVIVNVKGYKNFFTCNDYVLVTGNKFCYLISDIDGSLTQLDVDPNISPLSISNGLVFAKLQSGEVMAFGYSKKQGKTVSQPITATDNYSVKLLRSQSNGQVIFLDQNSDGYNFLIHGSNFSSPVEISKDVLQLSNSDKLYGKLLYDEVTKQWLVVLYSSNEAYITIITQDGIERNCFNVNCCLSDSLYFYKNTLYFVQDNKICYLNINSQRVIEMPCNIAKKSSIITRKDNKFVIINDDTETYVYEKP